jgi:hypothetical protein
MKLVKCGQSEAYGQGCSNSITGDSLSFHARIADSLNCIKFQSKKLQM